VDITKANIVNNRRKIQEFSEKIFEDRTSSCRATQTDVEAGVENPWRRRSIYGYSSPTLSQKF